MKNLKQKNGITLIALVITIIVMLILVAVTINMAVNGGLFTYAGNAARETETKKQEEQEYANIPSGWDYENLIDKYAIKKETITFYLRDENTAYQAEKGMTWEEWLDSDYNVDNFSAVIKTAGFLHAISPRNGSDFTFAVPKPKLGEEIIDEHVYIAGSHR